MNAYVAKAGRRRNTSLRGDVQSLLHDVGLRSTSQRIALARLLLRTAKRRVTAEILYDEVHETRCRVSRATVCTALRQFEQVGLLRRINVHGSKKAWFGVQSVDSRNKGKNGA